MTSKEVMAARCGLPDGGPVPSGKISRFTALDDKPGHRTGFTVWLADGDLLLSSAHPHSTLILHAASQHGGRSAK